MSISISPATKSVRVTFRGAVIAESAKALDFREGAYGVVKYIPRADVDMSRLVRTSHHTTCPFKGEASYFTIVVEGVSSDNAIWSYEAPLAAVAAIRDHVAFYPSRVDVIEDF